MKGLPVTIRTVDISADKPLEGMTASELRHESVLNPALGLRAIRLELVRAWHVPAAVACAVSAHHGPVKIMIPICWPASGKFCKPWKTLPLPSGS